jgi:hypothetical protein
MRWNKSHSPEQMMESFAKFNVQYLIVNDWLLDSDQNLKDFVLKYENKLEKNWENERNTIYKLNR